MNLDDIRHRLECEIEKSGKSKRAVSIDAGLGKGYLFSITNEGKDPSVVNLAKICDALDISLAYVLFGLEISPETEALMMRIERNSAQRDGILSILDPKDTDQSQS